ncbi:DUF91 domain-containing protein [Helicobacter sp. T3_23-1056]
MTTHVFIVDATTFKYHLEYQFVGTGKGDDSVDFNGSPNTRHSPQTENILVEMIADFTRIQVGDLVIFYLQQDSKQDIYEGKFYGVFRIANLVFLDNNDGQQYLKNELQKSLIFRCLIEPFEVYSIGVTEWEALDEIQFIYSPNQMLWSLIYRKLKGNRGNTMVTMFESDRLIGLIRAKNQGQRLAGQNFTFNANLQTIVPCQCQYNYIGRQQTIDILPRLIQKYRNGNQFEAHLQAYILQNFKDFGNQIGILNFSQNELLEWLGNEVSCGVGMQKIDIMASIWLGNFSYGKVIPIELKSTCVYPDILSQIQRYIKWIQQYYFHTLPNGLPYEYYTQYKMYYIQPIIVCRKAQTNNELTKQDEFRRECNKFYKRNNISISYVEFTTKNDEICFERIF